jgi:hypothetical protein
MARVDHEEQRIIDYLDVADNETIIDLCIGCLPEWMEDFLVEHPPYDERMPRLSCFNCGTILTEEDDWQVELVGQPWG